MRIHFIAVNVVPVRHIRSFAVLCVILAAAVGGTAIPAKADFQPNTQQSEKRKLIRSWQNYFRALHTLEYEWATKITSSDDSKMQNTFRYTFLWNGKHFRLDTDPSNTKKLEPADYKSTILTFDGKFYRTLRTTLSGENRFDLTDHPAQPIKSYDMPLPILDAFDFVFEEDKDAFTINTLQKDDIWRRFEKRIVNIKREAWQGHKGRWLFIEDAEYAEKCKVFVDDANNFPLFIRGDSQFELEGENNYSDVTYESQVTQTMKWRDDSTTYIFPLRIVKRGWSKDVIDGSIKRSSAQIIQEVTAPVKINQALKASRFHFDIPAGTMVWFVPRYNSKPSRPYPFVYDPEGGTLWVQEQRQRQRVAEKRRQIASLPNIYEEKVDGKTQVEEALREAKAHNKRVLLQFGANWCLPCHTLHDLLTKNSEIASILQRDFVVANIDANQHNQLLVNQYAGPEQGGIPFLVVLDADGKRLATPPNGSFYTSKTVPALDPQKIMVFLNQWKLEREDQVK